MKKILLTGLIALGTVILAGQQASAWTNTKFSIGLNWQRQSGGNSLLWGLWNNGQPPGHECGPSFDAFPGHDDAHFGPSHHHHHHANVAPAPAHTAPPSHAYYYPQPAYHQPQYHQPQYRQPQYQTVNFPGYYPLSNYFYPASNPGIDFYGR